MDIFYSGNERGFFASDVHATMPPDVRPVTIERWHELLQAQSAGQEIVPDAKGDPIARDRPAPAPAVPSTVTMRQARLALLEAGLLDDVEPALAALPQGERRAAEIEWEFAATVERASTLTSQLAAALGLDAAALDELFLKAASF